MLIGRNRASMLIPNTWDTDWTALDRVLSDQPPGVPGAGAALMAMQALGATPAQAAALVNDWQSAGGITNAALANAARAAAAQARQPGAACNAGHLPITPTANPEVQLLAGDPDRVSLLIQNNEPATGGATLLISTDPIQTSTPGYYLNFGPGGFGLLLDMNVWSNPIYAGWSGSPTVGGVIFYGSRAPAAAATPRVYTLAGR